MHTHTHTTHYLQCLYWSTGLQVTTRHSITEPPERCGEKRAVVRRGRVWEKQTKRWYREESTAVLFRKRSQRCFWQKRRIHHPSTSAWIPLSLFPLQAGQARGECLDRLISLHTYQQTAAPKPQTKQTRGMQMRNSSLSECDFFFSYFNRVA